MKKTIALKATLVLLLIVLIGFGLGYLMSYHKTFASCLIGGALLSLVWGTIYFQIEKKDTTNYDRD